MEDSQIFYSFFSFLVALSPIALIVSVSCFINSHTNKNAKGTKLSALAFLCTIFIIAGGIIYFRPSSPEIEEDINNTSAVGSTSNSFTTAPVFSDASNDESAEPISSDESAESTSPDESAEPTSPNELEEKQAAGYQFVILTESRRLHKITCPYIQPSNLCDYYYSLEEAESAGYSGACIICKPAGNAYTVAPPSESTSDKTSDDTPASSANSGPGERPSSDAAYVINKSNRKLHKGSCSYLPDVGNSEYYDTYEEAEAAGYRSTCGHCNP